MASPKQLAGVPNAGVDILDWQLKSPEGLDILSLGLTIDLKLKVASRT